MGIEYTVDVAVALLDPLSDLTLPHHAAAQENFLPWMASLGVHQRADIAVHARLGVLADGAGIDDDAVGALFSIHNGVAARGQHAADALGIGLVLLTAVGVDECARGDALREPVMFDSIADLLLAAQILLRDDGGVAFQFARPPNFVT